MNDIVFAGKNCGLAENAVKYTNIIVASGGGEVAYSGGKKKYTAGQIIVVPPLIRFTRTGAAAGDYYISLDKALLPFKEPKIIGDDKRGGIAFAAAQADFYFNSEDKNVRILSALGALVAGYVAANAGMSSYSPVVETVLSEISKRLTDNTFSLDDALKKLPLNYDYIRKLFKKEVGLTPHEYLVSSRMKLAGELILSGITNQYSNYTVAQIAETCGYSEPLYFSRVFKKYYGVAPSEYGK